MEKFWRMNFAKSIYLVRAEAGGEVFEHVEDAILEVLFQRDLAGERLLAEVVEQAARVRAREGGGAEERDEKAEVFGRTKRFAVREGELEESMPAACSQ